MNNSIYYDLTFSHFLGIGPIKFNLLLARFSSSKKAYEASYKELEEVLGSKLSSDFIKFKTQFDPVKKMKEIREKEITVITQQDSNYPSSLRKIPDPPIALYLREDRGGAQINFEEDILFGIVGTRKPTAYGEQITRKFAEELAACGFIIVSGMALGVDSMAHLGAVKQAYPTIAVLGCGVDLIYPPSNKKLYEEIIEKGGIVLSEFPPGMTVLPGLFIARNRLISGLSRGVLVIEGLKESGGLITARYAGQQGKEVFAPPAPLTSPMSYAPNMLLKEGAILVTRVEDILEELKLAITPAKKTTLEKDLSIEERTIVQFILSGPARPDDIRDATHLSVAKVSETLSLLEIQGVIEKNSEGKYQVK